MDFIRKLSPPKASQGYNIFILVLPALGLALVAAVLGIALFIVPQHYFGKDHWLAWQAQRRAKGDRFEWSQLLPPDLPDRDNFAKAPLVRAAMTEKEPLDPAFKALSLPAPKAQSDWGLWRQGRRVNLDAFAEAYGQPDLMKALAPFGPALRELDTASRRPGCKLAIDYREREMPGLRGFRSAARMLQVRALARLAGGDGDGALDDLFTSLRMADQFKAVTSIGVELIGGALVAIAMQVVWEGCADHRWQARHLKAIGDELRRIDLLASARLAWEGERVGTVDTFIRMAEGLGVPRGVQDADDPPPKVKPGRFGKGWIYRNLLEMDRDFVATYLDVIAPGVRRVYPERQLSYADWEAGKKYRTDLSLSAISFRAKFALVARESQLQSLVDQGAVVCALESYRLERGDYPGALGQLVPGFLPRLPWDITTGGPLHYARQDPDHFLLYSVGWDRVDQGGILGWKEKAGKQVPDPDIEQGDWVWMRPLERP